MGKHLDLDDVAATSELATKELAELRAALAMAREVLIEVQGLIEESAGVYGLHLNGDPSPWDELEAGGRFERLTTLPDALAALAQLYGAQAGEEGGAK